MRTKALLVGLLFVSSLTTCGGRPTAGASSAQRAPSPVPSSCTPTGTVLHLVAKDLRFSTDCLAVPPDTPFTIAFENQDPGIRHNVAIHTGYWQYSVAAPWLFMGEYLVGPATTTYHVGGLPAGRYVFLCDVHHDQMTGHFVVTS